MLSCIPDYIAWIILVCGIGYHLLFGENILHSILENAKDGDLLALYGSHGLWLYLWMYGAYIHADTFLLRCLGAAQADPGALLYGIFSHAAGFQEPIVHGHLPFYR